MSRHLWDDAHVHVTVRCYEPHSIASLWLQSVCKHEVAKVLFWHLPVCTAACPRRHVSCWRQKARRRIHHKQISLPTPVNETFLVCGAGEFRDSRDLCRLPRVFVNNTRALACWPHRSSLVSHLPKPPQAALLGFVITGSNIAFPPVRMRHFYIYFM